VIGKGQDTDTAIKAAVGDSAKRGITRLILPLAQDRGWWENVVVDEVAVIAAHEITRIRDMTSQT